jgi:DNA-directed RNA polymerase subunit RPC12/RpoP
MPKCERCNKRTFDGVRWKSQTVHAEFYGKYLCHVCSKEISSNEPLNNSSLTSETTPSDDNDTCARCGSELGRREKKFKLE